MTELEYALSEAENDGAQVIRYQAPDEPDESQRVVAVVVEVGGQSLVASIGWGMLGPFCDVFGFADGERADLHSFVINKAVMVAHDRD